MIIRTENYFLGSSFLPNFQVTFFNQCAVLKKLLLYVLIKHIYILLISSASFYDVYYNQLN